MLFAPDTEVALRSAVNLVNTLDSDGEEHLHTVADLDRYARQVRLPRRPDLYGFRAYGALAGAAGIDEGALVEWIATAVDSVERLWCAGADALISEFSADAVDRALACLCGIATMWARKVQGQLQAGFMLAANAWPVAA